MIPSYFKIEILTIREQMVPLDSNGLMTYSRHKTQLCYDFKRKSFLLVSFNIQNYKKQTVQHYFKWDESTLNKFFAAFHENIQIIHETIQGKGFYNICIYILKDKRIEREKRISNSID